MGSSHQISHTSWPDLQSFPIRAHSSFRHPGLSLLVDSIDHPKPPASTEATVLGPFHTHEAQHDLNDALISHDENSELMLGTCMVKNTQGKPIPGVKVDIWETDSKGFYNIQYADYKGPDGQAAVESDEQRQT
jgi:protocatechuate 3,4-dioxygenase beta subunit